MVYFPESEHPQGTAAAWKNQDFSLVKTLSETSSVTFWSRGTACTEQQQPQEEATPSTYSC